jgi:UDP-N-acetylglucosamine 4,6-dehydratase
MKGGEIFVPKIPSMSLLDLAEAIAPGCRHEFVGIRPGEKLHEVLVPADEARHTVELDDMYVILPAFKSWGDGDGWRQRGRPVPEGFCFASDINPWKLSKEDLEKMVVHS